jgi:hypothetical protein
MLVREAVGSRAIIEVARGIHSMSKSQRRSPLKRARGFILIRNPSAEALGYKKQRAWMRAPSSAVQTKRAQGCARPACKDAGAPIQKIAGRMPALPER